jgi:hypothetical protein
VTMISAQGGDAGRGGGGSGSLFLIRVARDRQLRKGKDSFQSKRFPRVRSG